MLDVFQNEISRALGANHDPGIQSNLIGHAELPSCFAVSDLALASIEAAALEAATHLGAKTISVDRRLSALWFDMTLRPIGWDLPSAWDPIAGNYRARVGWIRLHTNAPHHLKAALKVLDCAAERDAVAHAVSGWDKTNLETEILGAGGAAAAMMSMDEWRDHPQGIAVAQEDLIAWQEKGAGATPKALNGLKVLDLTRVLAGPVATRFLAAFGADVLRIDPPVWDEPGVIPEVSLGKRRAGLDLTKLKDRDHFETLLSRADMLVHGYRPGALAGLGYNADVLTAINPEMIDISLCAYGWTGPWAQRRGFDSNVQMSCGIAAKGMELQQAQEPIPLPVQALDHATGYLIAASALRALAIRNESGKVMAARLSLARTAALLTAQGARASSGEPIETQDDDFDTLPEHTDWGPAHRVKFPVLIEGTGPVWPYPAGRLRTAPPRW